MQSESYKKLEVATIIILFEYLHEIQGGTNRMLNKQMDSALHCGRTATFATFCIVIIAAALCVGSALDQNTIPAQNSPTTWTVLVGGEAAIVPQEYGLSGAWQFMRFYPENITVNVGDKIIWKLSGSEPHTVTFPMPGEKMPDLIIPENETSQRLLLNPLVILPMGNSTYNGTTFTGSGQLDVQPNFPREYNLTFNEAGDFEYFCAFHSMMKGRVKVLPVGTVYPETQEQIDQETARLLAMDMEAALKAALPMADTSIRPGPDGTTIHEVKLGFGNGRIALMRFIPTNLTIFAGDSIEWTQGDVETPHTVSFLSGDQEPELILIEPQQMGPPKFVLNPVVQMPAGGKVYNGTGYFNSGAIWGKMVPIPGPQNYTLTFDKPGTYEYLCIFHDYMGMKGQIEVVPKN
jgi:plastocyanin